VTPKQTPPRVSAARSITRLQRTIALIGRLAFESTVPMRSLEDHARARTVSAVLGITVLSVLLVVVIEPPMYADRPLVWAFLGTLILSYILARLGHFRVGGSITLIALGVMPILLLLVGIDQLGIWRVATLQALVVALVLTYILYNVWYTVLYGAIFAQILLLLSLVSIATPEVLEIGAEALLSGVAFLGLLSIARQYAFIDRLHIERTVASSEARYRAIIEDQTELICRWLPDETTTFVNDAYCRFVERTPEMLLGESVMTLVEPADLAGVRAQIAHLSRHQPTVTYEHRMHRADGVVRWLQWTDHAIFDGHGTIIEYQSVGRDITSLKAAEESEREQRMFAEALRANASVISSTLNLDEVLDRLLQHIAFAYPFINANIMLVENGIARMSRSSGHYDEAYAALVSSLRLRVSEVPNLQRMSATGLPNLMSDSHHSGEWLAFRGAEWIRSTVGAPIRLEHETIGFLILNSDTPGTFTDKHALWLRAFADQAAAAIRNARLYEAVRRHAREMETQVKTRTTELELERSRLSAIFDSTGEGIVYTEDGIVQYVNPTFCKLLYCAPDQVIGASIDTLYSPNASDDMRAMMAHYSDIIREIGIFRGEIVLRRIDGTDFDAGLTISPIGSIDDRPARAVTVVRDISQEKALEAQRSNLLSYASHELRTPLTNLKTRLYVIRRRPDTLMDHLPVLELVTSRMQHLIETMLDVSRLERGIVDLECLPVDLVPLIEETAMVQRAEADSKRLTLRVDLPVEPLMIDADAPRITQVLTNLVSNALNYTPAGGTITVSAKRTGDVALMAVSDTGIGIAPEHLLYIFEPFFRVASKIDGTGLGLSIVKQIVTLHKGEISVQSEVGVGSRFIIRIPLYVEERT